jgi:hypothetical protein
LRAFVSKRQDSTSTGSSKYPPEDQAEGSSSSSSVEEADASFGEPWAKTIEYISPGEGWKPTPIVDITLSGPADLPLSTMAVVDSGADGSALPLSFAAELGIDLDADCACETGMSSSGDAEHRIFRPGLEAVVYGHRFRIDATFSDTPLILLGQEDFFMKFHIAFDRPGERFTLSLH